MKPFFKLFCLNFALKEVEDNEDSDEDLDEMAKQMEQEMTNMSPALRQSPRKRVPPSPLSRGTKTTVMGVGSGGSKTLDPEKGKYEKQVTIHVKRENENKKVEGILGEKSELRGIKRITFVSEELETRGEIVNSEVALVNPKPILCGHHNSAFQKFSKTSPKQEKVQGKREERPVIKPASEIGTCDNSKKKGEEHSLIHGKRIECLRQHAFRPVSVNQEETDSIASTESTGFNIKLTETKSNTTENKSSSVQNNQDDQEGLKCKLTESDGMDVDLKSALSIRTLRKSLSLPEGKPPSDHGGVGSPLTRKKRISSLTHRSSEKESEKYVSNLKSVPESPRRSQRNKSGDVDLKSSENIKACASKETVQNKQKIPSRLTRSKTMLLSTNDLDSLCQRSRSRMKIPSGKRQKEEISAECASEIKKEDMDEEDECGKTVIEHGGGNLNGVTEMTCDQAMYRQNSLGFSLKSPPVLKSPPIVLPSQKEIGVGTACKEPRKDINASREDRHSEKQMEDFVDKSSKENLDENGIKVHQCSSFVTDSVENIENSVKKDRCKKHENTNTKSVCSDTSSVIPCKKKSDGEKEGLVEEAELPRQESMGFVHSGDSGMDPVIAVSSGVSVNSTTETGLDSDILASNSEYVQSASKDLSRNVENSFRAESGKDVDGKNNVSVSCQHLDEVGEKKSTLNGDSLQQNLSEEVVEGDSLSKVILRESQNSDVGEYSGRKTDTGLVDLKEAIQFKEPLRETDSDGNCDISGIFNGHVDQTISHASTSSEGNVKTVKQSLVSESHVSCVTTKSVSRSAGVKVSSECKIQTNEQISKGSVGMEVHVQSLPGSSSASSQPPTSFPVEGSSRSSFLVYVPSLSKLVQKGRLPSGMPSSTVVSPEMENIPAHPPTDNSSTPRSPSSMSTGGPVSPLPPSPFHFFLPNPISPLPPSPVKEVVPISPLCTSPFDLEEPVPIQNESSESHKNIQISTTKTSITSSRSTLSLSSVSQTTSLHQCSSSSQNMKETRTSQLLPSGKKLVQSDASPCSFHAVAPPDAIPVKAQTAATGKPG